jgi:predicted amidophosphoribosyltransferase
LLPAFVAVAPAAKLRNVPEEGSPMKYHPIRIYGQWSSGWALDRHVERSVHLYDDEFGNPHFDTLRTEVGEALYRLKYQQDKELVDALVRVAVDWLRKWKPPVELLVAVPPSNTNRRVQPVALIAQGVADKMGYELLANLKFRKKTAAQIKNVKDAEKRQELLEDAFTIDPGRIEGRKVLLFDDLIRSGATMNELAATLRKSGKVADVYALALTKTKNQ